MKVLVTGSNGFLGGLFVEFLKKRNISYQVYDRNNPEKLTLDFDSVVNFGGLTPNSENADKSLTFDDYYSANVGSTERLLETIIKNKNLKRFINIGTAAEYGFNAFPINEAMEEKPVGFYGESKLKQGELIKEFFKETNVKVIDLRLFNVAGLPKRSMNKQSIVKNPFIFESLARQFGVSFNGKIVVGNKGDVRDYVDVEDIMRAIFLALETEEGGQCEIINICSGVGSKLEHVVSLFGKVAGRDYDIYSAHSNEPTRSIGDNSKAKKILNWSPEVSLEESIKKMIW